MFGKRTDDIPQDTTGNYYVGDKLHWHVSRLSNWDKNEQVRIITEANWEKLKISIKRKGVKDALKIDNNGIVYDGNHRLKAVNYWLEQGITTAENGKTLEWLPIVIENPETEAEKWEIAFDKNGHFAQWNKETLANFSPEYDSLDLPLINIDFGDQLSIDEQLDIEESPVPPKPKEKKPVTCPKCSHIFIPE